MSWLLSPRFLPSVSETSPRRIKSLLPLRLRRRPASGGSGERVARKTCSLKPPSRSVGGGALFWAPSAPCSERTKLQRLLSSRWRSIDAQGSQQEKHSNRRALVGTALPVSPSFESPNYNTKRSFASSRKLGPSSSRHAARAPLS